MARKGRGGGGSIVAHGEVMEMTFVAPNMVVVKTTPGFAQAAARLVDDFSIDGVVGTVAGDDTILIVVDSKVSSGTIMKTLSNLFSRVRRRA